MPVQLVRQRLVWWVVAMITGWMTSTCAVYVLALLGVLPTSLASETLAVLTIVTAFALYRRFVRLGQVDETPVILAVVAWTVALGLVSM